MEKVIEKIRLKIIKFQLNCRFSSRYVGKITIPMIEKNIKNRSEEYVRNFWKAFHNAEFKLH